MPSVEDVTAWMTEQVARRKALYQEDAVWQIEKRFGREFVYDNEAGNRAISKEVLTAFNNITRASVIWSRSERYWRPREPGDAPGRMQP